MNVEYTGRHYEITPSIRKNVETSLTKIRKILGNQFETKVILTVEKHRHKAEITINPRNGPLVSLAHADDMPSALNEAFAHLQKQAVKYKTRWRSKKRHAHKNLEKKWDGKVTPAEAVPDAGYVEVATASLLVHKFPAVAKSTEVHLVRTNEAVALRPLTLEEAIKEAHFKDHDVFVFRNPEGRVMVLHRSKQGKMELIEVP